MRHRVRRSRVPLHRRLRQDPASVRRWLIAVVLAGLLATLVGRAVDEAEATRSRWGRTQAVWVADRPIRPGDRLDGAVRRAHWPMALVPERAVEGLPPDGRAAAPIDAGGVVTASLLEATETDRRRIAVPLGDAPLPVQVGDRVDLWATEDPATVADGQPGTRQVAAGARVAERTDRTVVVELAPAQVAAVASAAATATITLVGR